MMHEQHQGHDVATNSEPKAEMQGEEASGVHVTVRPTW